MSRKNIVNFLNVFILIFVICLSIFLVKILLFNQDQPTFKLLRVIVISRHNARTPTSKSLTRMTPLPWPKWEEPPGYLTKKGFLLEGQMGKYFSSWFSYENILNGCPLEDEFFVYANSMERTMMSAKAFIERGYPNCNISIYHTNPNQLDPVFSPYIHNTSTIFKKNSLLEMNKILNQLNLKTSYLKMQDILNYGQSELCKLNNQCNMSVDKNKPDIEVGKKPKLSGPLKLSSEAVDAFLMGYYNGFGENEVAWGKLKTTQDWDLVLKLTSSYHNVVFNSNHVAKDLAMPLLKYTRDVIVNKNYKITLLMGHDANINVLLHVLSVKPYVLAESFVPTPIGGKIVIQKWLDVENNKNYLKMNYVYQSTSQLRNGINLSLENPPMFQLLELNNCKSDKEGHCLWDDFVAYLNTFD